MTQTQPDRPKRGQIASGTTPAGTGLAWRKPCPPTSTRGLEFPPGEQAPGSLSPGEQLSPVPPGKALLWAQLSRGHGTARSQAHGACGGWHPPAHRAPGRQDHTETPGDLPGLVAVPGSLQAQRHLEAPRREQPQLGKMLLWLPRWWKVGNNHWERKGKGKRGSRSGAAAVTTALGTMGRAGGDQGRRDEGQS